MVRSLHLWFLNITIIETVAWGVGGSIIEPPPPATVSIIVIFKNHRWWDLTIVTQPHWSYKRWYSFGWKPDDGLIRPKRVVLYSSSNKHR